MIELRADPEKGIWAESEDSLDKLTRNHIGVKEGGKITLNLEEALYIITFMNGTCAYEDRNISFNELLSLFPKKSPRQLILYNAYRDWRDRGLIIRTFDQEKLVPSGEEKGSKKGLKRYPMKLLKKENLKAKVTWYPKSLISVLEDETIGKHLFNEYWIGQYGVYKQERGSLLQLDFLETVFLGTYFGLKIIDADTQKLIKPEKVLAQVVDEREYTRQLYDVYEDWRLRGYIVKTGFKFGSHFRIYFPGAQPNREDKWVHSKHVLHVFPKEQKMLISEWARAVRVAHGVKKTFLLSIPEMTKEDYIDYPIYFIAYRRKKEGGAWVRETPGEQARYLLVPVSEDEHIGGIELASLLEKAKSMGLELILSIIDRETAITYYVLKRIVLPGSKQEYYEIEWMKP